MTFEDTLKIPVVAFLTPLIWYAKLGGKYYVFDNGDVREEEEANVKMPRDAFDCDGNPVEESFTDYREFSKCFISFNTSAQKIRLNDGSEYVYSYYVIAPLKKILYPIIPKEGDRVRITKADGTIDCEKEVRGFVTYKKRYLKIWL